MKYAFISYFREDSIRIKNFLTGLNSNGVEYWIDESGLESGDDWEIRILDKIRKADAFVLFVSSSYYSRKNSYVHREISIATSVYRNGDYFKNWFVPILLEDIPIPRIAIGPNRYMDSLHFTRAYLQQGIDWIQQARAAILRCFSDPYGLYNRIHIRSDLDFSMTLLLNESQYLSVDRKFIDRDDYIKRMKNLCLSQERPIKKPPYPDPGLLCVEPRTIGTVLLPPDVVRIRIECLRYILNHASTYGYVTGVSMSITRSNMYHVESTGGKTIELQATNTPSTGLLFWKKPLVMEDYYLREVDGT